MSGDQPDNRQPGGSIVDAAAFPVVPGVRRVVVAPYPAQVEEANESELSGENIAADAGKFGPVVTNSNAMLFDKFWVKRMGR